MTDMIVKLMANLIAVLGLATKQIKHGRFCECPKMYTLPESQCVTVKFGKKLLGDSEVEAVLQRLDRLTQEEARMTVAQTLGVVHGLVDNMKIVMQGAQCVCDLSRNMLNACSLRWQDVNRQCSTRSGYISQNLCFPCSRAIVVSIHQMVNEMNKMNRPLFLYFITLCLETKVALQVTSCKGTSNAGSLLPIHQQTTTSSGKLTIMELQHGSLRPMY